VHQVKTAALVETKLIKQPLGPTVIPRIIMSDEAIPSISTGVVGSRFVSQSDIEAARARRDEQWKAAYARFLRLLTFCLFLCLKRCLCAVG
jgi:hypothetical protein